MFVGHTLAAFEELMWTIIGVIPYTGATLIPCTCEQAIKRKVRHWAIFDSSTLPQILICPLYLIINDTDPNSQCKNWVIGMVGKRGSLWGWLYTWRPTCIVFVSVMGQTLRYAVRMRKVSLQSKKCRLSGRLCKSQNRGGSTLRCFYHDPLRP